MAKMSLSVLFLGTLAIGSGWDPAWGATVAQAPLIEATPIIGGQYSDPVPSPWQTTAFPAQWSARLTLIDSIADGEAGRSVLGTPGKNIWVCSDWNTILVIYGRPSGDPNNIFLLWKAYSFDAGNTWETAISTIGPGAARRIYPGIITPRDTLVPYVAYQHATYDGSNYTSSSIYFSYDEFFPFNLYTPRRVGPDSSDCHGWLPSMVTTPRGDTVIICWQNSVTGTVTGNCYCKRSFDGGLTWTEPELLMIDTQGNPSYDAADTPRMQIGEGGYIFGLFNWQLTGTDRWVPYYTESFDYGATWSVPQRVWPSWPPYPDATCWWYCYDVVLDTADNYRPHCAVKLGIQNYEFGDVWECHPTSGTPGNWSNWICQVLIGDGAGGTFATQPTIGIDPNGNLAVTFSAWFIHPPADTWPEIGVCRSFDCGAIWSTPEPLTRDPIYETCIELASQLPDSCELHGIYVRERDNCQSLWHFLASCSTGIEETGNWQLTTDNRLLQNFPNPFSHATTIRYSVPPRGGDVETRRGGNVSTCQRIRLSVYDLAGRLVRTLADGEREAGFYQVVWDGKDGSGRPMGSGVYFYCLSLGEDAPRFAETRRMVLVR